MQAMRTLTTIGIFTAVALSLAFAFLLAACPRSQTDFVGKDAEMMAAGKRIAGYIDVYFAEGAEYPESLDQVKPLALPSEGWPVNPYNGKPIEDTGSPTFDKQRSVGMVYYQKMARDEQVVNYQLHIFGDKGKLYIIGNTAVGVKE